MPNISKENISTLQTEVNNTTETNATERIAKIQAIDTKVKTLIGDNFTYEVKKEGTETEEKESKSFDENTSNDEIDTIIVPMLMKDITDTDKTLTNSLTIALKSTTCELKELKEVKQKETEEAEDGAKTEETNLVNSINTLNFDEYKDLLSKALLYNNTYIREIQKAILAVGASNKPAESKLKDSFFGPVTEAGVKTIQKYLNTTYSEKLVVDGKPGHFTLTALLAPVSATDPRTRLEKMITDQKSGNLKLVPEQVAKNTTTKKEKMIKKATAIKDNSETLTTAAKINLIEARLAAKKFRKAPSKEFITARATALQKNKTNGKFQYNNMTYYYNDETKAYKEDPTKSTANKEKTTDNSMLSVMKDDMEKKLISKINQHPIRFKEEKYTTYYNKNINKPPKYTADKTNKQIIVALGEMQVILKPENFFKKDNTVNYTTLIETIKQQVKINVDAQEKQEATKIELEKAKKLKEYLSTQTFPLNLIYPEKVFNTYKEGEQNQIKAFFKNFQDEKVKFATSEMQEEKNGVLQLHFWPNQKENKTFGQETVELNINKQIDQKGEIVGQNSLFPDVRKIIDDTIAIPQKSAKTNIKPIK